MVSELDRTSFIGLNIPPEVKLCVKNLDKVTEEKLTDLLKVVQAHLHKASSLEEDFAKCVEKYGEEVFQLYPGLLKIVQSAVRLPQYSLNEKDFKKDLTHINIPKKFHDALVNAVFGPDRDSIDELCLKSKPRYPTLESYKWRVDVAISTSKVNRVLEPSILMKMNTSDGKSQSFEVSKEKFHELRYAVAYILKQMQQVEKRSVLQIKS